MKPLKLKIIVFCLVMLVSLFLAGVYASGEHEVRKTFKNKKVVQISTFSGDGVVKKASGSEVEILFIHSYSNTQFEPQFEEDGDKLVIKEKFHLSGTGDSTWNISIPDNTSVLFQSISGNFTAEGIKGNITAATVSGDIAARDCKGELNLKSVSGEVDAKKLSGNINVTGVSSNLEIEDLSGEIRMNTASGDIKAERLDGSVLVKCPSGDVEIKDARGSFEVKAASGDIHAEGIIILKESSFKVASGDIYIGLAKSAEQNLSIECASGDAILNYNGNPIEGYFEFKAIADRGDIISPFPFDKEEEEEKWGKKYLIKSFKKGLDIPKIRIYTANGKAELRKK